MPGEGFRLFAMPRAGDPDSDAYKLAARQSNYRAALCIALTAHVATLVPATIYDLWRTTSVRVVTLNFVEMYTRLKNQYGLMTANELTARCEQLKIPAPPGARYEDIVAAHQNIHQDLSDNARPRSPGRGIQVFLSMHSLPQPRRMGSPDHKGVQAGTPTGAQSNFRRHKHGLRGGHGKPALHFHHRQHLRCPRSGCRLRSRSCWCHHSLHRRPNGRNLRPKKAHVGAPACRQGRRSSTAGQTGAKCTDALLLAPRCAPPGWHPRTLQLYLRFRIPHAELRCDCHHCQAQRR